MFSPKPCAADRSFDSRGNDERQRAFIGDGDVCVLDAERMQNVASLLADAIAVVQVDARMQIDLDAARGALLERHVQVGADVAAGASGLAADWARLQVAIG